ncbi:MAG TPA: PUA domain-containing protein [Nitrososphaerales archaeon]|nr:PUA domain-containing protein [Nitrososphaerales archaeon]
MKKVTSGRQLRFWQSKFRMSLDYIFGKGTSKKLDFSDLTLLVSSRTGRLRQIVHKDSREVLFSFRPNGSIAPTVSGAQYLLEWSSKGSTRRKKSESAKKTRPRWVVTVIDGVSEFVSQGKTVFCRHVAYCDDSLRANEDVVVLNEKGELLAVGKSVIAGPLMKQFKRGAAVKVREGASQRTNGPDEL